MKIDENHWKKQSFLMFFHHFPWFFYGMACSWFFHANLVVLSEVEPF